MKNNAFAILLVGVLTMVGNAGCEGGASQPGNLVSTVESPLLYWSFFNPHMMAVDLIGRGLNGRSFNGKVLDGHMVVAVSLDEVALEKGSAKNLKLKNTMFFGSKVKQSALNKAVGALFTGTLDDGDALPLRIDAAESVADPMGTYAHYLVTYPVEDGWVPLCGVDEFGYPVFAIPLNGLWDYRAGVPGGGDWIPDDDAFTFACEGFVLAKCVAMGYPPWLEGKICDSEAKEKKCEKTSLAAHHQACSRLLRADYCGDGSSYTADDTLLDAYDGIGIRDDTEDWQFEAEWDADGARCINALRIPDSEPPCLPDLVLEDCGDPSHFESGTLMMSELEPDAWD